MNITYTVDCIKCHKLMLDQYNLPSLRSSGLKKKKKLNLR